DGQQAGKRVPVEAGQCENDHGRPDDAQQDCPEEPLVDRQGAPIGPGASGQPHGERTGKPGDEQDLEGQLHHVAFVLPAAASYAHSRRSATRAQLNRLSTSRRAALPRAAAHWRSSIRRLIAAASAAGSRSATSRPVRPSSIACGSPPTRDATTGVAVASASRAKFGNPSTFPASSWTEGTATTSAAAARRAMSSCN